MNAVLILNNKRYIAIKDIAKARGLRVNSLYVNLRRNYPEAVINAYKHSWIEEGKL